VSIPRDGGDHSSDHGVGEPQWGCTDPANGSDLQASTFECVLKGRHGRKKAGVVDHIGCEWFVKRVIVASGRGEAVALWHQRVTARFGDQDGRAGGVFLDLLPQPVDVRLERVSGEPGIVAPDLLQ
jgi:hypothetical protein